MSNKHKSYQLSEYEEDIVEAIESGDSPSLEGTVSIAALEAAARNTLKKDKRINVRLSSTDLAGLQKIAEEEGIPYQTLISSLVHKYVEGSLVDVKQLERAGLINPLK